MPSVKAFENEYHPNDIIVGGFLPSSIEQMTAYNKVIVQYLGKEYGKEWRTKARADVLGVDKQSRQLTCGLALWRLDVVSFVTSLLLSFGSGLAECC